MNKTKKQNAVESALNTYELAIENASYALRLAAHRAANHPKRESQVDALNHMASINEVLGGAHESMIAAAMAATLEGAAADLKVAADQLAESVRIEISIKRGTNDI